jgi:hypothetical protein
MRSNVHEIFFNAFHSNMNFVGLDYMHDVTR